MYFFSFLSFNNADYPLDNFASLELSFCEEII